MRDITGWVGGALCVGALVGAFHLGGRVGATPASGSATGGAPSAQMASGDTPVASASGWQVQCEPGQRAVVGAPTAGALPAVSCVSEARPVPTYAQGSLPTSAGYAPAVYPVSDTQQVVMARPAVLTPPTEVYQPRVRRTTYQRRGEAAPAGRSWERSAVIIGSSAAVGAAVGGLAKGKKGALIGGIVGGGAATVWDQVTRRRSTGIYER